MKYKTVIITTAGKFSSVVQEMSEEEYKSCLELFKSMFEHENKRKLSVITLTDEDKHDYIFNPDHVIGFEFVPVED